MKILAILLVPLGFLLRGKRAGRANSVRNRPELKTGATMTLTSPSFADGEPMPSRHAMLDLGPNSSPELAWSPPPAETVSMLLVFEDTDVPMATPGLHMATVFAPEPARIAEGELTPGNPRFAYLPAFRGRTGYQGPRPLPGHGVHHYGFHLYALKTRPAGTDLDSVLKELPGQVLAEAHLEGTMRG